MITGGLDGRFSSSYLLTHKRINATFQSSKNDSHLRKDDFFPSPVGRWRAGRKLTFLEALLSARHRIRHFFLNPLKIGFMPNVGSTRRSEMSIWLKVMWLVCGWAACPAQLSPAPLPSMELVCRKAGTSEKEVEVWVQENALEHFFFSINRCIFLPSDLNTFFLDILRDIGEINEMPQP